jgi:hypothetical protein
MDKTLNSVFGMSTFISLSSILISLVNTMYFTLSIILELDEEVEDQRLSTIIAALIWCFINHGRLFTTAFIAHSTRVQVKCNQLKTISILIGKI